MLVGLNGVFEPSLDWPDQFPVALHLSHVLKPWCSDDLPQCPFLLDESSQTLVQPWRGLSRPYSWLRYVLFYCTVDDSYQWFVCILELLLVQDFQPVDWRVQDLGSLRPRANPTRTVRGRACFCTLRSLEWRWARLNLGIGSCPQTRRPA